MDRLKIIVSFFLFCAGISVSFSQTKPQPPFNAGDCDKACPLLIEKLLWVGPLPSPKGAGTKMEVHTDDKNSLWYFEKEHNTAWFIITVKTEGDLCMDIIPSDYKDDYDFLLFKADDPDCCNLISQQKLKPIRSNRSHNDTLIKSKTGLKHEALKDLVAEGKGDAFLSPVQTKAGEKYLLVIDKVNESAGGYKIKFYYPVKIDVTGTVTDENNKPIKTEITLTDPYGDELVHTESDDAGKYGFHSYVNSGLNYYITYLNDSSFVQSKVINTNNSKNSEFHDLKTQMPKLKGGKKYVFENINFYGGSPEVLPESTGSLMALYLLMKKNKKMEIRIEGHVNDPDNQFGEDQKLSDQRALTVYNFLVSHGIAKERLSTKGFSNAKMLFPHPENEGQAGQNRRVEINVLKVK